VQTAFQGVAMRSDIDVKGLVDKMGFHDEIVERLSNKINGQTPPCSPTAYQTYLDGLYAELSEAELQALQELTTQGLNLLPFYAVLVSGRFPGNSDFYPNAAQGAEYAKRLTDLTRFWDVKFPNITLYSVNGKFFRNDAAMVKAASFVYKINATEAQALIDMIQQVFEDFPAIGYDFPIWSLNSASFEDYPSPDIMGDNSVLMGDGLIMFFESISLGTYGPDYMFFHEFSHQIQFAKNLPQLSEGTPDSSRYLELQADAFAAYFGRHPRGAAIPFQSMVDFVKAAYVIGDCEFDNPGHHGTPNQRAAAVAFAALQVDATRNKIRILSSGSFINRFNRALPYIIQA
jgi:hypothetical protein